jgi:hypothetical protein
LGSICAAAFGGTSAVLGVDRSAMALSAVSNGTAGSFAAEGAGFAVRLGGIEAATGAGCAADLTADGAGEIGAGGAADLTAGGAAGFGVDAGSTGRFGPGGSGEFGSSSFFNESGVIALMRLEGGTHPDADGNGVMSGMMTTGAKSKLKIAETRRFGAGPVWRGCADNVVTARSSASSCSSVAL